MKTVAIVIARMTSARLPGKALLPLAGKPALKHIIERIGYCESVDNILVATSTDPTDDVIAKLRIHQRIPTWIFRGSLDNVMERVIDAAKVSGADLIVQITSDCPMVDPQHIDHLIDMWHMNPQCDIATNVYPRTWPDGLDILVYSKEALWKVEKMVTDPALRNHVGWNMLQHPDEFDYVNWLAPNLDLHWPELGLTLDTPADYTFLNHLFEVFYDPNRQDIHGPFQVEEIIKWLRRNPGMVTNSEVKRKKPEEG